MAGLYESKGQAAVKYVVMILVAALMLLPFVWLVSSSLKSPEQVFALDSGWIPRPIHWNNYLAAFQAMPVLLYTRNTILITLLCILGYLSSGSLVAYAFSRLQWPGRDFFFFILLATMMIPAQVTIIPLFIIFQKLRWINTYYPLILPAYLTGWPFFIFLLRQFFLAIPNELSEAATVDGAGHLQIFWSIVIPLSKPALATVAIFAFLLHWNDFFGPLIYLTEDHLSTLALGLAVFAGKHPSEWSVLMSVSIVMLIPSVLVFFFCQRYFVEGITLTGIKQ
jgi:ABC-type glycerol-3-phosphate transport system permease component